MPGRSAPAAPLLAALSAAGLAAGCASVTGTPLEPITIQTVDRSGNDLSGARCELSNAKGKWIVTSPGSVTVTRSNDNMVITCRKEGLDGGVIGAAIDHDSGAAYEYPHLVRVVMGTTRLVEPPAAG